MPINGPFKSNGNSYWTINNVKDGEGNLVKFFSKEKALKSLAAIKMRQNRKAEVPIPDPWDPHVLELADPLDLSWINEITAEDIAALEGGYTLNDVEIARVGTYETKTGRWVVTQKVLEDMASNFDPDDPIPGNVDHVREGGAKGWITSLRVEGESLLATISDISADFYEQLIQKKFATRSVEAYREKGNWFLNAFAWLGAKRPAMKTLNKLQLAGGQEVEVFYADTNVGLKADDIKNVNNDGSKDGRSKESQDKLDIDASRKKEEIKMAEVAELERKLAEEEAKHEKVITENKAEGKANAEKLAEETKKREAVEEKLAEANRASALTEASDEVEKLIKAGQATPAMRKAGLNELMVYLAEDADELEIKASDANGKETITKATARKILTDVIGAIPEKALIKFSEETNHSKQKSADTGGIESDTTDLAVELEAYKAAHPDASHEDAVKAVTQAASGRGRKVTSESGRGL